MLIDAKESWDTMAKGIKGRIEEFEKRYRLIADNLVDAIWVVDAHDLNIEFASTATKNLSGYSIEEYKNISLRDRLEPEVFKQLQGAISDKLKLFQQGLEEKHTLELPMINKAGNRYWIEVTAKFYREKNGRVKLVGVSKNITQRKIVEAEKESLIEELRRTIEEKERLQRVNTVLRKLLPICAACKRIRDENGMWWPLDAYIETHYNSDFTHTVCDGCKDVLYKRGASGNN